jgi:hypothetical protein
MLLESVGQLIWAVKNTADLGEDVREEYQQLLSRLKVVEEPDRHRLCAEFVRDAKKT